MSRRSSVRVVDTYEREATGPVAAGSVDSDLSRLGTGDFPGSGHGSSAGSARLLG